MCVHLLSSSMKWDNVQSDVHYRRINRTKTRPVQRHIVCYIMITAFFVLSTKISRTVIFILYITHICLLRRIRALPRNMGHSTHALSCEMLTLFTGVRWWPCLQCYRTLTHFSPSESLVSISGRWEDYRLGRRVTPVSFPIGLNPGKASSATIWDHLFRRTSSVSVLTHAIITFHSDAAHHAHVRNQWRNTSALVLFLFPDTRMHRVPVLMNRDSVWDQSVPVCSSPAVSWWKR